MAAIAGKSADLLAANYDTLAHEWNIDFVTDPLETTNWDESGVGETHAGWRTYIAGLSGWTGAFNCRADSAPATAQLPGSTPTAKFYVDQANLKGYTGTILVTGSHPAAAIGDVEAINFDFTGSGIPTVGTI